ncbi:MAG: inositol monophosphatase family protein [Mariprofundaceae bacterium]|nr:inositol monophosphatase family protein [Mariprofundaceae bacterium]
MLYVAVRAARKAGDLIARSFENSASFKVEEKKDRDFVTDIDRKAEALILREIQQHYPSHGIVAEESGSSQPDAPIQWHIDPLDGTTNFIHGFPHFSVSIAAWQDARPLLAVVYDPIKNELFEAERGQGAFMNRRRLRVTTVEYTDHCIFASGLPPYSRDTEIDRFQQRMDRCMRNTEGYRRAGSAALDLAYVAAGRLDAYWESGLCSWDIAAGVLLVQEAGGIITNTQGGTLKLEDGDVLCGNARLHRQFLRLLNDA